MASKSMHYKPYPARLAVLGLLFIAGVWTKLVNAVEPSELKRVAPHVSSIKGVYYDKKNNHYQALSISGKGPRIIPTKKPIPVREFSNGTIKFILSAYPDSVDATKAIASQLRAYPSVPAALTKALSWLDIAAFPLTVELVAMVNGHSVYYRTPSQKAVPPIYLRFYDSLTEEQAENYATYVEPFGIGTFSHELFHFLARWKEFPRMNELREETYASLFGHCVAYPLIGHVESFHSNLRYGPDAFANPHKDLKKLRKQLKKARINGKVRLPKSAQAGMISKYYFQAVANDRVGDKIQSDRIPAFYLLDK